MSIKIQTSLDTTGANQDLAKLQTSLKGDLGDALKSVEAKADSAQKSLAEALRLDKAEFFVAKFGDVKDILEKAGEAAFGLSEETVAAASKMADLAQKGASLGSIFGPIGTVVGAALGAVTGYFAAASEEAAKTEEAIKKVEEAIADASAEFDTLSEADLSGLITQVAQLQEQLDATKGFSEQAQRQIDALAQKGIGGLSEAFTKLAQVGVGDEFAVQGKSLDELLDRLTAVRGEIQGYVADARGAAAATQLSAEAGAVSADNLARQKDAYDTLVAALAAAKAEEGAVNAAILAHTEVLQKSTAATVASTSARKDHTAAVVDEAKAIEDASRALVASINEETRALSERAAVAAEARAEGSLLDTAGAARTAEDLAEVNRLLAETYDALASLATIPLPLPQLDALEEATRLIGERVSELKGQLQEALVEVGVGAATQFFDAIEAGERPLRDLGKTFALFAAAQLRGIGTALVGQGIQDELRAASLALSTLGVAAPAAIALAGVGAAEIAAGLAMGASGALLGRRAGGAGAAPTSSAGSESLGAREREASGPTELAPVKIYLGPEQGLAVFAGDARGVAEYGRFTEAAQQAGRRAPR